MQTLYSGVLMGPFESETPIYCLIQNGVNRPQTRVGEKKDLEVQKKGRVSCLEFKMRATCFFVKI